MFSYIYALSLSLSLTLLLTVTVCEDSADRTNGGSSGRRGSRQPDGPKEGGERERDEGGYGQATTGADKGQGIVETEATVRQGCCVDLKEEDGEGPAVGGCGCRVGRSETLG